MAKYLINDEEAVALRELVKRRNPFEKLAYDTKKKVIANFPFRFKTKEVMGATVANKANADIYFFGGTTNLLADTDYVVDDSSEYAALPSGAKGVCIASSAYHILNVFSTAMASQSYMCLASTSYSASSTNIVVDTLEPMDGVGTTLTTLTVKNKFHWPIINNGNCYVKWNAYSSEHDLLQTECT